MVSSSREGSPLIGAIAEIHPESVTWSYLPAPISAQRQLCREPVLEDLGAERSDLARRAFAARLLKGTRETARSNPHELRCAMGGQWGPDSGTEILLSQSGALLIGWEGEEVLTLERLNRPAAKEPMEPHDYEADRAR